MSVGFYQSLKAKRAEDVEEIQRCAKELNKEYGLLLRKDGPEPWAGIFGLDYIAEGIDFTVPASASDEISKFLELVQCIVKSHPDIPVEYHEGSDSMGYLYYSQNGELIECIPGTMCICVDNDDDYSTLKDCALDHINDAGFVPVIDDERHTISWEYIMDDDSKQKTESVISSISRCLSQVNIVCYNCRSYDVFCTPCDYCKAINGIFEWKQVDPCLSVMHEFLFCNYELSIQIARLYIDPVNTFERILDAIRSDKCGDLSIIRYLLSEDHDKVYISKLKAEDKKWLLPYMKWESRHLNIEEKLDALSSYCDTHDEKFLETFNSK